MPPPRETPDPVSGDPDAGGSISRRRLLKQGAIGAGVAGAVLAAPSMLSFDAAHAEGSQPCNTLSNFSWFTQYALGQDGLPLGGTNRSLPPGSFGGVTVSPSVSDPTSQLALPGGDWRNRTSGEANWHLVQSQQFNGVTGNSSFLKSRMGQGTAANAGASYTNTLAFSQPVRNLTFSILDIDLNLTGTATAFRDVVTAAGFGPTGSVPFVILAQGSAVTGSGVPGTPFYGTASVGDTVSGNPNPGCVTICFTQPVTSAAVTHFRGYLTGPSAADGAPLFGGQHIGISDLTWCAT